jgi:D-beta-D-heptose 7-phosphate kinase/D-beta-D-heptose 1-phosphate adenosyltransferase
MNGDDFENSKLKQLEELLGIRADLRKLGKTVVWTNGCYDLMHAGHIDCLRRAKKLGNTLIVGVNSDESVRRIKGEGRPIHNQDRRAFLLSELISIDYLLICNDENMVKYLRMLQPDIYAKGGDYTLDTMNQEERRTVEEYDGKTIIVPSIHDLPTTSIVDKLLEIYLPKYLSERLP